jgi:hypothetical protein
MGLVFHCILINSSRFLAACCDAAALAVVAKEHRRYASFLGACITG